MTDWADALRTERREGEIAMREKAAKKVDNMDAWRDCEKLGFMDPETGARECSLDVNGGSCLCQERYEAFEEAAAKIRAIPVDDEITSFSSHDLKKQIEP